MLLKKMLRPEYVFLVIFLPISIMIAVLLPVGAGYDEGAHLARIDQLSQGAIVSPEVDRGDVDRRYFLDPISEDTLYGGTVDRSLIEAAFEGDRDFLLEEGRPYAFPTWETAEVSPDVSYGDEQVVYAFSNTAINTPLTYVPQTLTLVVARLFTDNAIALVIVIRIVQELLLACVMFFAIRVVPLGKWPLAVIGMLPVMSIQNAGVSADVMCTICCIAFYVALLHLIVVKPSRSSRKAWIVLAIAIVCLGLVKMSYLPLMALTILIPVIRPEYRTRRCYALIGGACALSVIVFGVWYFVAIAGVNTGAMFKNDVHPHFQLSFILQHPLFFARILLNAFLQGDFFQLLNYAPLDTHGIDVYGPAWLAVILFLMSFVLKDDREVVLTISPRQAIAVSSALAVAVLLVFVLIATALYLQFTPVGDGEIQGIQTRYFLPILPFLLAALLVPYRQAIDPLVKRPTTMHVPGVCFIVGMEVLYALVIAYNFVRVIF